MKKIVCYCILIFIACSGFGENPEGETYLSTGIGAELDKNAVDFLQFPRQTLVYGAGDCDDISILYNSLLESVGIRTAFITIPGHKLVEWQISRIANNRGREIRDRELQLNRLQKKFQRSFVDRDNNSGSWLPELTRFRRAKVRIVKDVKSITELDIDKRLKAN